ncbi:MAG: ABC transporter substrate-binding protein [Burkholderiales bacterium]|jgi:ABC-type branched-subunit amino acid transport system substrate-binding protein
MIRTTLTLALAAAAALALAPTAQAQKRYDSGASDTEIRIGQTMPYSGPASAYGSQGKVELAYFKMLNAQGGINGRKVNLLSLDDGYSPPKTIEQTRKLVEQDEVLAIMNALGTPTNSATHKYLNQKGVPQLLVSSGASKWNDPKAFRWTTPFFPPYIQEGMIYAKHILTNFPNAKIAIISQNDDAGRDYVKGFKMGLGSKVSQVVKEVTYEVTDATVDSQVIALKSAGADTLFTMATPKFGAQVIRKVAEIGWKPHHYIVSVSSSQGTVLEPAGLDKSVGLITAMAFKLAGDPTWDNDAEMKEFLKFCKEWFPEGNPTDASVVLGYVTAHMMVHILKSAGDNLTRENILKVSTNVRGLKLPLLLPGVQVNITPDDYSTFNTFRTARFDGKRWALFGDPIVADGK